MNVIREARGDMPQLVYIGDRSIEELRAPSEFVHPETGARMTNLEAEDRLEWLNHKGRLITNANGHSSEAVHEYLGQHGKIGKVSLLAIRPTTDQLETFARRYPNLHT